MARTTKVTLNLEEDEEFRLYIKDLIQQQVRSVLREDLNGLIQAEIAKLRLLDPDSETMESMARIHLNKILTEDVKSRAIMPLIRSELQAMINLQLSPVVDNVKSLVASTLTKKLLE